jgi:hypothetical protein
MSALCTVIHIKHAVYGQNKTQNSQFKKLDSLLSVSVCSDESGCRLKSCVISEEFAAETRTEDRSVLGCDAVHLLEYTASRPIKQ